MYEVNEKELQKFCDMQDEYRWFITEESIEEFFADQMEELYKEWEKEKLLEKQADEEYEAHLKEIGVL